MIAKIEHPIAEAQLTWLTPEEGGRQNGPPPGPVYAATTAFADGGADVPHGEWILGAHDLSIIIEMLSPLSGWTQAVAVDYIAPDLAAPRVIAHECFIVFEGPHRVAFGTFTARYLD